MVDRWDDSDEETVTPSVPILPALDKKIVAPIVAKSLEETNIVANGDDGNKAVSDADDETSTSVYGIGEESDVEHEEDEIVISEFFDENVDIRKVFQRFTPRYVNIMGEFADVEIFLISLDGLLLELTAQQYLNWNLSGQTIVIANQVDRFLNEFSTIGGKFKLIWFTDLIPLYSEDTTLKYLRSFVSAYLLQSQWSSDIVEFCNPADSRWSDFLYQLTPSFLVRFHFL
ncbi:hypothetical protein AB6A40_010845 [Gnathostoma spinigerum]|uniref:ATP-dependent RNA helicase DDX60 PIN-like domain-containing protein n=1 Tax=Gnathostoma spinigerum TaxID=75299 RepID=A0ABD6EXS6_9BILA